jgi:hypothetical protein
MCNAGTTFLSERQMLQNDMHHFEKNIARRALRANQPVKLICLFRYAGGARQRSPEKAVNPPGRASTLAGSGNSTTSVTKIAHRDNFFRTEWVTMESGQITL